MIQKFFIDLELFQVFNNIKFSKLKAQLDNSKKATINGIPLS